MVVVIDIHLFGNALDFTLSHTPGSGIYTFNKKKGVEVVRIHSVVATTLVSDFVAAISEAYGDKSTISYGGQLNWSLNGAVHPFANWSQVTMSALVDSVKGKRAIMRIDSTARVQA